MKKIILIGLVCIAFVACNNDGMNTTTTDSTTIYEDNTGVGTTDTGMTMDTSRMDTMMNRDTL